MSRAEQLRRGPIAEVLSSHQEWAPQLGHDEGSQDDQRSRREELTASHTFQLSFVLWRIHCSSSRSQILGFPRLLTSPTSDLSSSSSAPAASSCRLLSSFHCPSCLTCPSSSLTCRPSWRPCVSSSSRLSSSRRPFCPTYSSPCSTCRSSLCPCPSSNLQRPEQL